MTIRAQALYDGGAIREQVAQLITRIKVIRASDTTEPRQLQEIIEAYYKFVEQLGLPSFDGRHLDPRELATFQRLNEIFGRIAADIRTLYNEYQMLSADQAAAFNRIRSVLAGTDGALQNALGTVLTGAIATDTPTRGHFVVLEDFKNDASVAPGTDAELGFGGHSLTLKKTAVNPVDLSQASVDVKADDAKPILNAGGVDLAPDFRPPYEGKYYAPLGEGEFEGGRLHFVTSAGKIIPAPTSNNDLQEGRQQMLDGMADSYHQVERVILSNREELDPGLLDNNYPYDFQVTYTIDIKHPVLATTMVLDPLQAGERAWLEVRDLQTSADGQSWESIPGLHDYQFYNVLTDEANKELSGKQVNALLSPSKYAYTGKGLWIFGQREFQYVRLVLLQKTPVPAPYEVLSITQERQVVKSKKAPRVLGIKIGSDKKKSSTERRERELTYEQSLQAFAGDEVVKPGTGSYKSNNGIDVSILGHDIFSAGGTTVEKGAWAITGQRTVLKTNAVRYVVGVRDLQILSAEYADASAYISKPWQVPTPIRQVSLRADHSVPSDWEPGNWIRYMISVDGGASWTPIAPLDYPAEYNGEARIPTTVLVNSGTPLDSRDDRFGYIEPGKPVHAIQVRIELSRPDSDAGASPVVRRFALEILTQETVDQVLA